MFVCVALVYARRSNNLPLLDYNTATDALLYLLCYHWWSSVGQFFEQLSYQLAIASCFLKKSFFVTLSFLFLVGDPREIQMCIF